MKWFKKSKTTLSTVEILFENGKNVAVTFEYPKGEGIAVVHAIRAMRKDDFVDTMYELLKRDHSVLAAMDMDGRRD